MSGQRYQLREITHYIIVDTHNNDEVIGPPYFMTRPDKDWVRIKNRKTIMTDVIAPAFARRA